MADPTLPGASDQDPADATLVFHEQADGRKVSRLPGGKVVLIDVQALDRVRDGEAWYVKLRHKETFAVADPVERVTAATLEASGVTLSSPLADAIRRAGASPVVARASVESSSPAPAPVPRAGEPPASPAPVAEAAATPAEPAVRPSTAAAPASPIDFSRLLRPTDRVALFIDGANTDGASRAAGYFVDFRRARHFFLGPATFYAAYYYAADFTASDPLQLKFFDFLSHAGYIVRRRPVKVIHDHDTGERIIKGNLDTEIVLDLVNTVDNYDVAFLFSGDSDFERAVDLLRSRGKRVFVVSARASLSRELAYVADKPIVYLEDHRDVLARADRTPG